MYVYYLRNCSSKHRDCKHVLLHLSVAALPLYLSRCVAHTQYLAALRVVADLVTRGEQDAVLCRCLLGAWSTGVTIIYTPGLTPHTPHTQHLHSNNKPKVRLLFFNPKIVQWSICCFPLIPTSPSQCLWLIFMELWSLSPHQHNTGKPKGKVKHLSIQLKGEIVPEVKLNY